MNAANVDVLVYPTWSNPAELIGQWEVEDGESSLPPKSPLLSCLALNDFQ